MNKIVVICSLTLSVFLFSCSNEQTNDNTETEANTEGSTDEMNASVSQEEIDQQILFIREKYGIIANKMAAGTYTSIELVDEYGGGFTTYNRSMDGENIRFASVETCRDHGCDETSYYFWDDQLIFKFEEGSFWVGNTDEVSEKRTYYLNENEIRCLTRTLKGPEGYDVVKKSLANIPQDTLQCNSHFDRATIKKALEFTNDEVKKIGTLVDIEDGAYPFFTITMNLRWQNDPATFSLNIEAIPLDVSGLNNLESKDVEFSYINIVENAVLDIYYNNNSVYGEYSPEKNPNWKTITGTLQGASSITGGDLPDELSIIPEEGPEFKFEEFINSAIVAANGKIVTAYYSVRESKTITNLKLDNTYSVDIETDALSTADHYICYIDDKKPERIIWISFTEDSKALQVKYKGSTEVIDLVFDKEEFAEGTANSTSHYNEMYDGKVNGIYKLTHAGNWDYVEYIREKDGEVFKFTIAHNANPYGKSPCF